MPIGIPIPVLSPLAASNAIASLQTGLGQVSGVIGLLPAVELPLSVSGLSAAGTGLTTATPISSIFSQFATVASGAGAVLPAGYPGATFAVLNQGAHPLSVYPPNASGIINALSSGAAYLVQSGAIGRFNDCTDPTQWFGFD